MQESIEKRPELVNDPALVRPNVLRFNEGLSREKTLKGRLSHFVAWYYVPEEDAVGPSKFIGYKDMTAPMYIEWSRPPRALGAWTGERPSPSYGNGSRCWKEAAANIRT